MTSLYDILKANRLGMDSDPWIAILGEAWKASEEDYKEYTGLVPYTFIGNGQPLISWMIKGNTVQSGTPTPDSPVIPQGTGERTVNLCPDTPYKTGYSIDANGVETNSPQFSIYCIPAEPETEYALSLKEPIGGTTVRVHAYKNGEWQAQLKTSPIQNLPLKFTTITNCDELRLSIVATAVPMLNLGSTALPYEPYGYKMPISSANTTTPVYLGELQTTRKIKKLVLTGQEAYTKQSGATLYSYNLLSGEKAQARDLIMCSHLPFSWSYSTTISIHIYSSLTTIFLNFGTDVMNAQPSGNTVEGLKEYLAAQYAAGTPVTVWYVLATEETGIVNEPLMKIGDYADTLSDVVSIPTVRGENVFDVDTEVKPSEVYIKYKSR